MQIRVPYELQKYVHCTGSGLWVTLQFHQSFIPSRMNESFYACVYRVQIWQVSLHDWQRAAKYEHEIRNTFAKSEISLSEKLTHWGRVTHMCVGKIIIIGSDNGLSPERRQAIIWTNAGILLIGPLGTNFNEILVEIQTFSLKKIRLKMSSTKFLLGLNVLMNGDSFSPTPGQYKLMGVMHKPCWRWQIHRLFGVWVAWREHTGHQHVWFISYHNRTIWILVWFLARNGRLPMVAGVISRTNPGVGQSRVWRTRPLISSIDPNSNALWSLWVCYEHALQLL